MLLGDTANADAEPWGKPLDGVRILAAEQMQALPYATQLLARLGAEVVKVEHPVHGESGRGPLPAMIDPDGRSVGRHLPAQQPRTSAASGSTSSRRRARTCSCALVPHFDVVAENFKPGTMARMGLGYDDIAAVAPEVRSTCRSRGSATGGRQPALPRWPAYASVVEAMSGIYEYKSGPDRPPDHHPGRRPGRHQLGACSRVIGVLAALRHRDRTGLGPVRRHRHVRRHGRDDRHRHQLLVDGRAARRRQVPVICEGFKASDGYVVTADRARAPVRQAGRARRPPRVERRPSLRRP